MTLATFKRWVKRATSAGQTTRLPRIDSEDRLELRRTLIELGERT
jgi:hypothetical protein